MPRFRNSAPRRFTMASSSSRSIVAEHTFSSPSQAMSLREHPGGRAPGDRAPPGPVTTLAPMGRRGLDWKTLGAIAVAGVWLGRRLMRPRYNVGGKVVLLTGGSRGLGLE